MWSEQMKTVALFIVGLFASIFGIAYVLGLSDWYKQSGSNSPVGRAFLEANQNYSAFYGSRTGNDGNSFLVRKSEKITLKSGKIISAIILEPRHAEGDSDPYFCTVVPIDENWSLIYSPHGDLNQLDWSSTQIWKQEKGAD